MKEKKEKKNIVGNNMDIEIGWLQSRQNIIGLVTVGLVLLWAHSQWMKNYTSKPWTNSTTGTNYGIEGFTGKVDTAGAETADTPEECPNVLVAKDGKYYLYDTRSDDVPGVNPIVFDNLEDYTEFLKWQKSVGIKCPVLYLQSMYDAQGNKVYRQRSSMTEVEGGGLHPTSAMKSWQYSKLVDSTQSDPPYNQGGFPAFDPTTYYQGKITPMDIEGGVKV